MTTLSKYEILAMAREAATHADVACDNAPNEDWYAYRDVAFATLCRADLVAENDRLADELNAMKEWKDAMRDKMEAQAAELSALRSGAWVGQRDAALTTGQQWLKENT